MQRTPLKSNLEVYTSQSKRISSTLTSATRITKDEIPSRTSDETEIPSQRITVSVRLRDLLPEGLIVVDPRDPCSLLLPRSNISFKFDHVFEPEVSQLEIFRRVGEPILQSFVNGFNGTLLAYGQSGTGKTYTLEGVLDDPDRRGITPRATKHIFDYIANHSSPLHIFEIRFSLLEIYCEKIRDLLSPDNTVPLRVVDEGKGGVRVENAEEVLVKSHAEFCKFYQLGKKRRVIGETNLNERSSRSHLIVTLLLTHQDNVRGLQTVSKLNLVDLAGSERLAKSKSEGMRLEEGTSINQSLTTLGNVINALTKSPMASHVPYRDSKLTRVLQDSLGGSGVTCLVICVSSQIQHEGETLSTLRFGKRSQKVQNRLVKNQKWSLEALEERLSEQMALTEEIATYATSLELLIHTAGLTLPNDLCAARARFVSLPDIEPQPTKEARDECICSVADYETYKAFSKVTSPASPASCNDACPIDSISSMSISSISEPDLTPKSIAMVSMLSEIDHLSLRIQRLEKQNVYLQATLQSRDEQMRALQSSLKMAHRQYNTLFEQYEKIFLHHHPDWMSSQSSSEVSTPLPIQISPPSPPQSLRQSRCS